MLERIKDSLGGGRGVILIVPEQQALTWDRICADRLPATDALNIETVSFTRLADSVFRRFGGTAKNYITDAKKNLIMWNAIESVRDKLTIFGRRDREDRYIPLMRRTVSEAKLYGLTPSDMDRAADRLEKEGRAMSLCKRLRELSLIQAAYDAMLHESYDDPEEILDALCSSLDKNDYFSGKDVYIDSFYTLTPKEEEVVRRVMRRDCGLTVTFAIERRSGGPHTAHIEKYVHSMARVAAASGREIRSADLSGLCRAPELEYIRDNLFNWEASPLEGPADSVRLVYCRDRYDESAVCASVISQLVQEKGASYSQIAVVAADMEKRRGVCDTTLRKMGIPAYLSEKQPLTYHPAIRLLIKACAVAAGGWRREDVTACAKTGLCGLTPDECDAFEIYTEKWRIRSKKLFCLEEGWSMNPDGYTDVLTARGSRCLQLANSAREKLCPPLEAFCHTFSGASTVENVCRAAVKLLCDYGVYESLREEEKRLYDSGMGAQAQNTSGVWNALCTVLDTIYEICRDQKTDATRFGALIRRTADSVTVGSIPDGVDRVVLGSASGIRLDGIRHIIILGACGTEFPASAEQNGFFSDSDKAVLEDLNIKLSPCTAEARGEELHRFWRCAASPSESLTVLIPGDKGAKPRPSLGAKRIEELLPECTRQVSDEMTAAELVWTSQEARYRLPVCPAGERLSVINAIGLDRSLYKDSGKALLSADRDDICPDTASKLFSGRMSMTQSRLDTYSDCPFLYYCRYILALDDGQRAEISPADVGNFVHSILECFINEAIENNDPCPFSEDLIVSRSGRLIREYLAGVCPQSTSNSRLEHLFERLSASVQLFARSLGNEFAQSGFRPFACEMKVGYDDSLPGPVLDITPGTVMALRGKIDRLDVMEYPDRVYVRVADYKTGPKSFSLAQVLRGRNVQLLLYLFSVCFSPDCAVRRKISPDGRPLAPAGALYFSAAADGALSDTPVEEAQAASLAEDSLERRGIVLSDMSVIRAMDKDISGKYAPAKLKKDGTLAKTSSVATDKEFVEISEKLNSVLAQEGRRIVSGEACSRPSPYGSHDPCVNCSMRPVCRHSKGGGYNNG